MKKTTLLISLIISAILISLFLNVTPAGKRLVNKWFGDVQKADDDTNYNTLKEVENTCRAMIASYNSDKLTYEQYKDSEDSEKQSWAEQAKMRANKTASTYNNYILKNNYVWKNDIPADIYGVLPYVD